MGSPDLKNLLTTELKQPSFSQAHRACHHPGKKRRAGLYSTGYQSVDIRKSRNLKVNFSIKCSPLQREFRSREPGGSIPGRRFLRAFGHGMCAEWIRQLWKSFQVALSRFP